MVEWAWQLVTEADWTYIGTMGALVALATVAVVGAIRTGDEAARVYGQERATRLPTLDDQIADDLVAAEDQGGATALAPPADGLFPDPWTTEPLSGDEAKMMLKQLDPKNPDYARRRAELMHPRYR